MPRRGRGDGTLFKRKDGYWVGGVELPPGPDGKRRTRRVVRKQRNDVLAEMRRLQAALVAGQLPSAHSSTTLGQWLEYWLTDILPHRRLAPSTIDGYRRTVRLYIAPRLGAKKLDRLQPAEVRQFYTELTRDVSARTAHKAHQVLNLTYKAAIREGLLSLNVIERVDKPSYSSREPVAFDSRTASYVIEVAERVQGPMWSARWATGFLTGARESEILGLEWSRVDLDAGVVDVSWQLQRLQMEHGCGEPEQGRFPCGKVRMSFCPKARWNLPAAMEWRHCDGTLVWTRPKTKASMRLIPLVPELVTVLRRIYDDASPNPHNLVFRNPNGRPFSQDRDQKQWRELLIAAGVDHVPQHSIRHSTASLLLEAGVDGHIIQQVIGHSNIVMTRHYQHVNMALAQRAWRSLGQIMPKTH